MKKLCGRVKNVMGRTGNPVKNQFIITTKEGTYFQSYDSIIAFRDNSGSITLDEFYWDYSVTTGKYRNIFLKESKGDTQEKINNGTYKLANLNKREKHGKNDN